MADIKEFLNREKNNDDILSLNVEHENIAINILFLCDRKTFLFAVKGKNIAWELELNNNDLKSFIPNDTYNKIRIECFDYKGWTTTPLFEKIAEKLNVGEKINRDTESNIKSYLEGLRQTKTTDEKYGKDGVKPYFWRFKKANPSPENLAKIKVNLGQEVFDICKENKVTVDWTADTAKNIYKPISDITREANEKIMPNIKQKDLMIYQLENGALELKTDLESETIWASQKDISLIYGKDQSVISRHIGNIFKDGEVDEKSNMQKMHIANSDKLVVFYSLDIILAVGYRTNSSKAIKFRKWATQTLKQHITQGYTINKSRVESDPNFLLEVVTSLNEMSSKQLNNDDTVELIKTFSYTWFSLQSYDEQKFPKTDSIMDIELSIDKLYSDLANLKSNLIDKKEATLLFGQEKNQGSLDSIFKNVFQNVFGQELYPSIEEKAAHILYFVVKNHPFNDGNKRSGAYAFIWLLKSFNYSHRITPETLATLTILIAESSPNDKDKMIGMVLLLLAGQRNAI